MPNKDREKSRDRFTKEVVLVQAPWETVRIGRLNKGRNPRGCVGAFELILTSVWKK